ncbi:MAG: tetratricopeptide repeat protein [Nitrospinota bacterium]
MAQAFLILNIAAFLLFAIPANGFAKNIRAPYNYKIIRTSTQVLKSRLLKKYHYEGGLQLILEERFEEALSFLKPILHEDPGYKRTGYLMGYAYQKLEKIEQAITTYEEYLENDKKDYQAVFNLAYAYMEAGLCSEAIQAFSKTLDQKPDYLEAHLHLSTCHNKLGNNLKAEQHLKIWNSREKAKSP